jgi:hypothetical protein
MWYRLEGAGGGAGQLLSCQPWERCVIISSPKLQKKLQAGAALPLLPTKNGC